MVTTLTGYVKILKQKACFGFLVILGCACLGSIRGALKEDKEPFIGVTQEDMEISRQPCRDAPDLTGIIPLAANQNRWRNFSYAVIYAGRGVVIDCIIIVVCLPVYHIVGKRRNRRTG